MKYLFCSFLILLGCNVYAQLNPELQKEVTALISTFANITVVVGEEESANNRIHLDTVIAEAGEKDSVNLEGIAHRQGMTLEINEPHVHNGKEIYKYSYIIDTTGTIISAFLEKQESPGKRFDVIDLKRGVNNPELQKTYLRKAKGAVSSFYRKFSRLINFH